MILHLDNEITKEVLESDESYRYRSLMGDNSITLKFSLPEYVDFPIGTWCEYMAERYTLETPANIKKNGTRDIEYTLIMQSAQSQLNRYKLRNTVDKRLKFSMCATPKEYIQVIVDNLNQRDSGWSVGDCIVSTEKTVSFDHSYVIDALQSVADAFETEWEVSGKTIHLRKVEYFKDNPLPLSYGRGNGFVPGLGRTTQSDSHPVEILYVQGGDRNIDRSRYGSAELLLPKSKTLQYEGRTYVSDADGLSIRRQDKTVRWNNEDSLDCSEIYPSRVGKVTGVEKVNKADNFYDIIDNTIPADLDYEDCLMEGETMTIIFQSGMLAGREFDVKYIHEPIGEKSGRRFEIVPAEMDGQTMPDGVYVPQVNDTYAVFGIMLPDAYVCDNETKSGASWDMFREAARYLYEHEDPRFTFTGELQGLWAKRNWLEVGGRLVIGGYILFSDTQFAPDGIPIRITGIKDYITSPYSPVIELSNDVSGRSLSSSINELENDRQLVEEGDKNVIRFTKRRFRDSQETMKMLEAALLDNFTNAISPVTVRTMGMLVGDESLQFRFVNASGIPISYSITYDNATKKLNCPATILQHMSIGITTMSPIHKDSEYRKWNMNSYASPVLDQPLKSYYLYAKVPEGTGAGSFLLSDEAIGMKDVSGYYHLLVGTLSSEYNGERSFVTLYGFTEILPGRITTDKIASGDGNTYFDLAEGKICGNIKFISSSGGLKDVQQGIDEAVEGIENRNLFRFIQFTDRMIAARGKIDAIGNYVFSMTSTTDDCYTDTYTSSSKHRFIDVNPGEIYTLSLKRKNNTRGKTFVFFRESAEAATYKSNISFYEDKYTFTIPEGITCIAIRFGIESVGFTEEFYEIKLEKGDKATAWSPSPEDLQAQIDVNSGTRNWIAKKYLLDWNDVSSNITERGSDEDGDYFAINQAALYQTIGGGGVYNDIFQGKIKYKENTQYAFKIRVKMAGKQQYSGLSLYFRYTDATKDDVVTNFTSTTITEIQFISAAGKTLDKIYCSYGSNDYRTKIYDIQLTEGNKQAVGYIIAEEDIEAGIIDKVELGNGGTNMLKNGSGEFGDNTYFPNCEFVGEQYNGSSGALIIKPDPKVRSGNGSQFIPIDRKKAYRIGLDLKGVDADTALYIAFAQYDIDKKLIDAKTAMYISGTLTKLSQDLNNGDTVVHFESLSGWNVTTDRTYQKGLKFWNYANSAGYVYPPETYSRNYYQSLYTDNSAVDKANNTITLDKPWSGGTVPAGTEVSQCSDGATHGYIMSGVPNTEWTHYETLVKGEVKNSMVKTGFNPACAFIRMWWQLTDTTDVSYMTNIFVREDIPTTDEVGGMIQDGIDGMEIGGENFITETDSDKITLYSSITGRPSSATLATALPAGTYVFSCENISFSGGNNETIPTNAGLYAGETELVTLKEDTSIYVFTVNTTSDIIIKVSGFFVILTITRAMLQRGNKPTAYQKAIQYIADAIEKGSTEINGGLLATNLFQLKGLNGVVTSGMSGLADNILLWGGGSYQQAVAETVATLLRKDGSGFFAKKKITWDKDGNLSVKEIDAVSGSIAGFEISNDRIGSDETSIVSPQGEMSLYRDMILFRKKNDLMTCNSYISSDNGGGSVALIEYEEKNNNGGATALTVRCKQEFENTDTLALHVDGNMRFIGKMSHYSTGYIGAAGSSIIRNNIKITNTFVFTSVSLSTLQVDLPTLSDIRTAAGVTDTYKITFLLHIHSIATGINKIYIRPGDSSVRMVNYNGNTVSGISLGTGNVLILRFYGNTYYQVQLGM